MSYSDDKKYGKSGYSVGSSVEAIATEIMTNGPVEAAFTVYSDFPSYKSGMNRSLCGTNNDFGWKKWSFVPKAKICCIISFANFLFCAFHFEKLTKETNKNKLSKWSNC